MWRAHVKFFVDYTVGVAKKDTMAQNKAVANLKTYTVKFGDFLATATGLPKLAVRNDLLGHVLELKGQLDAYAAGNYGLAATKYRAARPVLAARPALRSRRHLRAERLRHRR